MMSESSDLLTRYTGDSKSLGPSPGCAILSFWQGIFMMVYRTVALVSCIAVIIPAALALSGIVDIGKTTVKVDPDLRHLSLSWSGLVVAAGGMGVVLELMIIILRFLNIGYINVKINYFLSFDVFVDFLLSALFIIGGVGTIVAAGGWTTVTDINIAQRLSAACGMSFFCMGIFVGLSSYTLSFLCNKWNNKVIAYTLGG